MRFWNESILKLSTVSISFIYLLFSCVCLNNSLMKKSNTFNTNNNPYEYLGADGLPIEEAYNLYLKKCDEFKKKARKYKKDNLYLKNSTLHRTQLGYQSSQELEEEVLREREQHLKAYKEQFQLFSESDESMYECFTGKSRRIRVIREIHEKRNEEFTDEFDEKRGKWFTRYCILSRFIQAARKIILLNRLEKSLSILKTLKPGMISQFEIEEETKESLT